MVPVPFDGGGVRGDGVSFMVPLPFGGGGGFGFCGGGFLPFGGGGVGIGLLPFGGGGGFCSDSCLFSWCIIC